MFRKPVANGMSLLQSEITSLHADDLPVYKDYRELEAPPLPGRQTGATSRTHVTLPAANSYLNRDLDWNMSRDIAISAACI